VSFLHNLFQPVASAGGISFSGVLADIGGTQFRLKCDDAGLGAMTVDGHGGDANYDIPRTGDSNVGAAFCYRQTSGAPVWDTYGVRLGANIGGSPGARNRFSGAPATVISGLVGMTSGFINAWIKPIANSSDGAFFSLSHDAALSPYSMLRRTGSDTIQLYVSLSPANQFRIGKASLTMGVPMMVTFVNDSGVWRMRINGADPGASTAADGSGSGAYWLSTISTADTVSLGFLQRGGVSNACDSDLLYDLVIGSVAPTDQQIADLYAATLP
jgi:hypothetical protein